MKRNIMWLLVCSLSISINVVAAQEATELPDGGLPRSEAGQLLYTTGAEIFVVNSDLSATVNLNSREGNEGCASWMPDGNQIIFTAFYGETPELVYTMNADGSDIQRVTSSGVSQSRVDTLRPTADGSQVIWVTQHIVEPETTRLAVNVATGEMREVDEVEISRLLSPNGLGLAVAHDDVYAVDADGQETLVAPHSYLVHWSPDGERLAAITGDTETSLQGISVGNSDGSDFATILEPRYLIDDYAWSPNDQQLALVITNPKDDIQEYLFYVAVLTIETGELVYLTEGAYLPSRVWWSPDGSKISYTQGDVMGDHYWFYVMDSTGENQTLLADNILNCDTVMWRPGE